MTYARQYTILGALFGLIAPAGVLIYGLIRGGLPEPLVIFEVMVAGGVLVLGAAGRMIGRREDALAARNAELKAMSEQLQRQTFTDPLTGIANRRLFDYELGREVARAHRYHQGLALVMVDIDRFKACNDRHGHPVGDEVLRHVARLIEGERREGDTVSRYGGEEFVAILPHASLDDAAVWAERVRARLCAEPLPTAAGPLSVTASFGVAALARGEPGEALVRAADGALYAAKQAGRNRVQRAADAARITRSSPAAAP